MAIFSKYKTYIAAAGLAGMALYQLSQGDIQGSITSLLAAAAAVGLRSETAPFIPVAARPGEAAPQSFKQY